MKTPSTSKTNLNVRESPAHCPTPDAHPPTGKPESACATSALIRAGTALNEAAIGIAALEAKIASLEAAIRSGEQSPPLVRNVLPSHSPASSSIDAENRSHVDTSEAAGWLNRKPQTLRTWACNESGPLRPVRISGRLAWAVADIRRVLASTVRQTRPNLFDGYCALAGKKTTALREGEIDFQGRRFLLFCRRKNFEAGTD